MSGPERAALREREVRGDQSVQEAQGLMNGSLTSDRGRELASLLCFAANDAESLNNEYMSAS